MASDKSVRDQRQSARVKGAFIIVAGFLGRRKQREYKIKMDGWNSISKYGNYEYNKFEYVQSIAKYDLLYCYNVRIIESQIKAIERAIKNDA